jgi:D-alanyl-D-alanine carboxypeptidase/D-alanyl-D-alanine-endopeptidase (penicillin-binding protein 4)
MHRLLPIRIRALSELGRNRTGLVVDAASGVGAWSSYSDRAMRGASTTKLATAITSLTLFGTASRFPTRVVSGRGPSEVLLVGGGDPLLTSAQLRGLARSTARALLARVPAPPTPPTPGATPAPTPAPTPFHIVVRTDDSLYPAPTRAMGWPADYVPYVVTPVRPLVRDLRNGSDTAKDATYYFVLQLRAQLKSLLASRTDIAPDAFLGGRWKAAPAAPELARFAGNSTGAILHHMLLVSDNDVAEMMYRNNGIAMGYGGSWHSARVAAHTMLTRLGVAHKGWVLMDGSGVSRVDRVSSLGLVQLLRLAQSADHPELAPLKAMLPVAGVSGTLAARDGRFTTRPTVCARGKVFAKTGTLFDAIGLAGYALGTDGRLKAFAVLVARNPRYSPLAVRRAVDRIAATATGCY